MEERYGIIYRARNIVNSKVYIGQTTRDLEFRKKRHINSIDSKKPFHRAIVKYGKNSFKWKVLEIVFVNSSLTNFEKDEILTKREKYWMDDIYEARNSKNGYNLKEAGPRGKHNKETRNKMSATRLKRFKSKEIVLNHSGKKNPLYRHDFTIEDRKKVTELYKTGKYTFKSLAKKFNVSRSLIGQLSN